MILALVSGQLFRDPKSAISKGGKPYTLATVKIPDGAGAQFVRVMAWSDHARAELDQLLDGSALSVSGKLEASIYQPDGGEPRVSLTLTADQVLVLKKPSRKQEQQQPNPARGFDDEHPF